MESHKRLLGIMHIVYGSIVLLVFLILSTIIRTVFPFVLEEVQQSGNATGVAAVGMAFEVLRWIFYLVMLVGPIPSIIGGIAILNKKEWGLATLMVAGCFSLLSIPFGTALGIYTIWVFLEDQKLKKT